MTTTALDEIVERIRAAAADRATLSIRGGNTKAFYGEAAHGAALETAALAGITSYEPSELVVTVGAGTPLAELEALLAGQGQCLPFEPPRFAAGGTVGGMIAAGLSGPARASVGAVRDYLLGLTLINGRGEALVFGGQVMKNVAGYDVSRVLAGSMGALGLVAQRLPFGGGTRVVLALAAEVCACGFHGGRGAAQAQVKRSRAFVFKPAARIQRQRPPAPFVEQAQRIGLAAGEC